MNGPVIGLYGIAADGSRGMTEGALTMPPPGVQVICTGDVSELLDELPPFLLPGGA